MGFTLTEVRRGWEEVRVLNRIIQSCGGFLCGGYVRYMVSTVEEPLGYSDVDVYCPTPSSYNEISRALMMRYSMPIKHDNRMSLTLSKPRSQRHPLYNCPPIQVIKPTLEGVVVTTGPMDTILDNFDFSVTRAGLVSETHALVDEELIQDDRDKRLRLKNIHCPLSSIYRMVKYSKKGYHANLTDGFKILKDWSDRDEQYKLRIGEFVKRIEDEGGFSRADVEEFEALLRID
jgi:hypothetical protein